MRVHHQIYAVENWLVIRICSDGKTLVDRSNKFPETSLRPADDPWKAACAYVEETFKLSQRHFEIDEKELVQEGKTVSKYPGLATFARRHVITLRMLTGQSSDTPMPAFDAKYTWSTDTMKETPRHRSLILDDAKLVHGWTNESLLLLLRRHHVNVDILHKNPKLLAALLKSVNENESYFAQTANGELARVVCRMFLRLAFNEEVCVQHAVVVKKRTKLLSHNSLSFPTVYTANESFSCAARRCATTQLRISPESLVFATAFDNVVVAEEGIVQDLMPLRSFSRKLIADARITGTDPELLKVLGLKGRQNTHQRSSPTTSSTRDETEDERLSPKGVVRQPFTPKRK